MRVKFSNVVRLLLMCMVYLPILRPRMASSIAVLNSLYYWGSLAVAVSGCLLLLYVLCKCGLKGFSPIVYLVILYNLVVLFSKYINHTISVSSIVEILNYIAAVAFSDYWLKKDNVMLFQFWSIVTSMLVLANTISFFLTGLLSGETDATGNIVYFWNTRNHLHSLYMLCIVSTIILHEIKLSLAMSIWSVFVLLNIVLGVVIFNSSTLTMGVVVMFLFMYCLTKNKILYRPMLWFFGILVLNVSIVVFRIQYIFGWLISEVLKKSIDFTGRTNIWNIALLKIIDEPLFGYGQSNIFELAFSSNPIPAHNQLLDVTVRSGFIGLIVFLIMLGCFFSVSGKHPKSHAGMYVTSAFIGLMVMMISESCTPYHPWYCMMPIIYNLSVIDNNSFYYKWKLNGKGILKRIKVQGG